ncbi:MAG: hypothetical protein LAO08_02345 [Acidobacteriia bacterium]|nr:hypothetical protein [Terriglobia bacterium]
MAEIVSPRIESIFDPGPGPQDLSAKSARPKAKGAGKSPPQVPEISQPEDEEKHELDEMA